MCRERPSCRSEKSAQLNGFARRDGRPVRPRAIRESPLRDYVSPFDCVDFLHLLGRMKASAPTGWCTAVGFMQKSNRAREQKNCPCVLIITQKQFSLQQDFIFSFYRRSLFSRPRRVRDARFRCRGLCQAPTADVFALHSRSSVHPQLRAQAGRRARGY